MNQIYKLIWSATQGAWVVCSELGSRKKQGGTRAAVLVSAMVVGGGIALPAEAATCGDGSTATECTITALQESYNPRLNDERVGQAIVDGTGQTLRLTGKASNVEQGIESHIATTADQVSYQDANGNELRDAQRLTVGQKTTAWVHPMYRPVQ